MASSEIGEVGTKEPIGEGFSDWPEIGRMAASVAPSVSVGFGGPWGAEGGGMLGRWNACYECDRIAKLVVGPRAKQVGLVSSRVTTTTVRY